MMTILIIGASGYVGKAIHDKAKQSTTVIGTHLSSKSNAPSVQYDIFKDNITEKISIDDIKIIVFAAMVENSEKPTLQSSMAQFAKTFSGARLIYISSDAVFSGTKGFYREEDSPEPKSTYGENLYLCENIVKEHCPNHCIVRPSYLYGLSNGNLDRRLAETQRSLVDGKAVEFFCDMYKSPLGVRQFAEAVIEISASDYVGTLHIAGERISVFDFHREAMTALGVDTQNLHPIPMPKNDNYLQDTSLDISQWKVLTHAEPLSINATLNAP